MDPNPNSMFVYMCSAFYALHSKRQGHEWRQSNASCCSPPTAVHHKPSAQSNPSTSASASPPLCDIPSCCCFFTEPWTVMRRVAAFCLPLRPVFPLVLFSRWRSAVVGVLGLCRLLRGSFLGRSCPLPPHSGRPPPASLCFCGHVVRQVAVSSRGPGQSSVLPFTCYIGSLCAGGRCSLRSCWRRVCVSGAQ